MYSLSKDPSLESEMKLLLARAGKRHLVLNSYFVFNLVA